MYNSWRDVLAEIQLYYLHNYSSNLHHEYKNTLLVFIIRYMIDFVDVMKITYITRDKGVSPQNG